MEIKIKKLIEDAKLPTHGSDDAAGWDLYAAEEADIHPAKTAMISTGAALEIPKGYFGAIYARSGLASKRGLRPANCVGAIDSDYRGPVCVAVHNDNYDSILDKTEHIEKGERIAQLIIQKFEPIEFTEVEDLSETDRGEGGFGSTGSK